MKIIMTSVLGLLIFTAICMICFKSGYKNGYDRGEITGIMQAVVYVNNKIVILSPLPSVKEVKEYK